MKQTERILAALVVTSLILVFTSVTGGATLSFLFIMLLSGYYYVFSFALLNDVGFGGMFQKSSYAGVSVLRIIGAVITGITLATVLIGILYAVLHYLGADSMFWAGFGSCAGVLGVALVKFIKTRAPFYRGVLVRVILIGGAGVVAYLTLM